MSEESKTVSIAPEDIAGRTVDNVKDAMTDAIGVVVPGVSSTPEPSHDDKDESKDSDTKDKD